eukprot:SAG11_NODE_68_length_18649_cov_29.058005_16_plen_46_part_00
MAAWLSLPARCNFSAKGNAEEDEGAAESEKHTRDIEGDEQKAGSA